ncbi:MAG: 3-keto-5-aminohexanoate cleavage enzyme [Gammaproteobacteria bacterium]|jgi:3-keto-5-aminohexanoate cleavage enzyme
MSADPLIIKACLNGIRGREVASGVPWTPREVADEARRCADAGASMVHFHARSDAGAISYDPAWYSEADRLIREETDLIVNHTTVRTSDVPIATVLRTLRETNEPVDMIALNPGYLVLHLPRAGESRETLVIPNSYSDIQAIINVCTERGIAIEPTALDTGFLSSVAMLVQDGLLSSPRYLLLEFGGAFGDGFQIMPGNERSYRFLTECTREVFPDAIWMAHGIGDSVFDIAKFAIADGAHVRVGFEDRAVLEDGRVASSNAEFVQWAVEQGRAHGREPASTSVARSKLLPQP